MSLKHMYRPIAIFQTEYMYTGWSRKNANGYFCPAGSHETRINGWDIVLERKYAKITGFGSVVLSR